MQNHVFCRAGQTENPAFYSTSRANSNKRLAVYADIRGLRPLGLGVAHSRKYGLLFRKQALHESKVWYSTKSALWIHKSTELESKLAGRKLGSKIMLKAEAVLRTQIP